MSENDRICGRLKESNSDLLYLASYLEKSACNMILHPPSKDELD